MKEKLIDWHYPRPDLAQAYLELFRIGLVSARGLFARRRMGKTEFLKRDFIPAAEAAGYVTVYVNLWDMETDPATAIVSELYQVISPKGFSRIWSGLKAPVSKVKASGKIPGLGEGALEAELKNAEKIVGTRLTDVMRLFDKSKKRLILVIDEAQVLAYEENKHFSHALRAALDIRKQKIKVIFAGSSEATLRRMFGVSSEPFYNWAPLEPFQLLGKEFVAAMVDRVNQICKHRLSIKLAMTAFSELKNTPEFFRRYIENYINSPKLGSKEALEKTLENVFNDKNFKNQWESLLAADQIILSMIARGVTDLHSRPSMQQVGKALGIEDSVNKNTIHNALRRLSQKNIITKIEQGIYQFEDEAFADWVKHRE